MSHEHDDNRAWALPSPVRRPRAEPNWWFVVAIGQLVFGCDDRGWNIVIVTRDYRASHPRKREMAVTR